MSERLLPHAPAPGISAAGGSIRRRLAAKIRELGERRIEEGAPELELLRREAVHVVGRGAQNRGMTRMKRLDVDGARHVSAAGAAGHLGKELEGLLGRTKIRKVQDRIGGEDSHRCHVREIVSLGDHLRSDQAPGAARQDVVDDRFDAAAPRGIPIEDGPGHVREELREPLRDALGARSNRLEE